VGCSEQVGALLMPWQRAGVRHIMAATPRAKYIASSFPHQSSTCLSLKELFVKPDTQLQSDVSSKLA
jgi:hypothetical protein